MKDLELVSTPDLIAELMSRFDHSEFTGLKVGVGGERRHVITTNHDGDAATVLGHMFLHAIQIADMFLEDLCETEGDDGADAEGGEDLPD